MRHLKNSIQLETDHIDKIVNNIKKPIFYRWVFFLYLCNMDFKKEEIFLLNLKVGEGYNNIVVTKRTNKRIYLSDGKIVHIKKGDGFFYLDAKGNSVKQILRDIEGYLVYLIHSTNSFSYN